MVSCLHTRFIFLFCLLNHSSGALLPSEAFIFSILSTPKSQASAYLFPLRDLACRTNIMCILGRCTWRCCGHVEAIHDPDCDDPNCTVVINADIPDVSQSTYESQQYCPVHGHLIREARRTQGYHYRNQQARRERVGKKRVENMAMENANALVQRGVATTTSNTPVNPSIFPEWVAGISHSALNRFAAPLPPNFEEQLREGSVGELHNVRPSVPHPDGLVLRNQQNRSYGQQQDPSSPQQGSSGQQQGSSSQQYPTPVQPSQAQIFPGQQPPPGQRPFPAPSHQISGQNQNFPGQTSFFPGPQQSHPLPGSWQGGRGQSVAPPPQTQTPQTFDGNIQIQNPYQHQAQNPFGPNTQGAEAPTPPGKL
jgi:hypothetical protein